MNDRQRTHALVLGAGALGSFVIEHLAKAGVGWITVVDPDSVEPANVGRHLLGVDYLHRNKAAGVAAQVNRSHPSCKVEPSDKRAESWIRANSLAGVDVVFDFTGEPDVRWHIDQARRSHPCRLLIGWMEPFVAAAHVCVLPTGTFWIADPKQPVDRLRELEAIDWPADVIRQVPGCSSRFQAYTATNAGYAVALAAEHAVDLIDGKIPASTVTSWVRGQKFLNNAWPGLMLRDWASSAKPHHGISIERAFV